MKVAGWGWVLIGMLIIMLDCLHIETKVDGLMLVGFGWTWIYLSKK